MSEKLPVFPLQLVLFPGEDLNLHIFEPRYRELINDCHRNGITFGIPTVLKGGVLPVATEAILKSISKTYEDGRMDITVTGGRRFKINEYLGKEDKKLYDYAVVEWLKEDKSIDENQQKYMMQLIREVYSAMQLSRPGLTDQKSLTAFEAGHYIGLSVEDEYHLLSLSKENRRQQYIIGFLEKVIPTMHSLDRLKERVSMNGHFRELGSPEF
jgi:Lon protease-like protein